jgi:Ca2+-binding RTX toxin-like protein
MRRRRPFGPRVNISPRSNRTSLHLEILEDRITPSYTVNPFVTATNVKWQQSEVATWHGLIAFEANETTLGVDVTGDGTLNQYVLATYNIATGTTTPINVQLNPNNPSFAFADGVIAYQDFNGYLGYFDLATGVATSTTFKGLLTSISGGKIAFRSDEESLGQDVNHDGLIRSKFLLPNGQYQFQEAFAYYDITTGTATGVFVPNGISDFQISDGILAFNTYGTDNSTVAFYSIASGSITELPFHNTPISLSNGIITVLVPETYFGRDITGDGTENQYVVAYYDISTATTVPLNIQGDGQLSGGKIVVFTTEMLLGQDLDNDGSIDPWNTLAYYDIASGTTTILPGDPVVDGGGAFSDGVLAYGSHSGAFRGGPNVNILAYIDFSTNLPHYDQTFVGTPGNDNILIEAGTLEGTLKVTVNTTVTDNIAGSSKIYVGGLVGDDTITVNAAPAGGLVLEGGDGSDSYTVNFGSLNGTVQIIDAGGSGTDSLLVNGTTQNDTLNKQAGSIAWRPTGSGDAFLEKLSFYGLDTVELNGGAGNDTMIDPGQNTTILGGPGDDTIIINATTGNGVVVDGGDGSDTYIVAAGSLAGPVSITDTGTTGTDTLTFQGTAAADTFTETSTGFIVDGGTITVGTGLESLSVNGGGGTDSFVPQGTLPVPVQLQGLSDLIVYGTSGNDTIVINPVGAGNGVTVNVNGTTLGTFNPTGRIIAYGLAGDDDIQVAGGVTSPVWLYGGDGNDRLKGGNGSNVLEGGAGDDLLAGGNGRDLLIGGGGADRLIGNGGDDILIGGTSAFDADDAALTAIMAEWNRTDIGVATRVAHLSDQTSSIGFLSRLNGDYFLIQDVTVFNDSSKDTLTGSAGSDWFFAGTADKITDLSASDKAFIFV